MTRIYIVPAKLGSRGQLYDIHLGALDGEHLGTSRTPFYGGARLLLFRGIIGRFEMWDAARPYPRMVGDIETCAGLMVGESDKGGLKVRPWKPFPDGAGGPQSAISDLGATTYLPTQTRVCDDGARDCLLCAVGRRGAVPVGLGARTAVAVGGGSVSIRL